MILKSFSSLFPYAKRAKDDPIVVLAPMAGVTDYPFRKMVEKYSSPSWTCSEMIASQSLIRYVKKSLQMNAQKGEKVVVQIAGNDPEIMAESAKICADYGAMALDINMGCPVKKIAINSYAGSALMKDEVLVGKIFRALVKATPLPLSVKIRKGWDQDHQNALKIARIAQDEGLSHVTLHGRTRCQLFRGEADWDFIEGIYKELSAQNPVFPLIGNGDITTVEKAQECISKAHGLMIGRGIYGRPWFIGQVIHFLKTGIKKPDPSLEEQCRIAKEHAQEILDYYGEKQGLLLLRKHLSWYSKGLKNSGHFRTALFSLEDAKPLETLLNALYEGEF